MTLWEAAEGAEYIVRSIKTNDRELIDFLFSLGCFGGASIAVISRRKKSCVIAVKDGRYSIDDQIARAIQI